MDVYLLAFCIFVLAYMAFSRLLARLDLRLRRAAVLRRLNASVCTKGTAT
jgi:hypothetical protein